MSDTLLEGLLAPLPKAPRSLFGADDEIKFEGDASKRRGMIKEFEEADPCKHAPKAARRAAFGACKLMCVSSSAN